MAQFKTAKLSPSSHEDVLEMRPAIRIFNIGCMREVASFTFRPLYSGESVVKVSLVIENKKPDLEKFPPILSSYPSLQASCLSHRTYQQNVRLREPNGRSGCDGYDTDPRMCQEWLFHLAVTISLVVYPVLGFFKNIFCNAWVSVWNTTPQLAERIMVELWRDFWIRETGTGQQVAQLHERYMMMMIYSLYGFLLYHLCIFIICFVCITVMTTATQLQQ